LTTTGEKLTLLAEIIRISIKGATGPEISSELSLSSEQTDRYLRFLQAKRLVTVLDGSSYFPSEKGLSYLSTFDEAADLVDLEEPEKPPAEGRSSRQSRGIRWDKAEIAARMRDIIER